MHSNNTVTESSTESLTAIESTDLDGVTGGCAACGNAACQPGQALQGAPQGLQQSATLQQFAQQFAMQLPPR